MKIDELDTPSLLVNYDILKKNIQSEQYLADIHSKKLRPHIKTHKSVEIAKMQMQEGAVGICTAKVSEAEIMVDGGITDVLVANEIVGAQKLDKLVALAKKAHISTLVDSMDVLIPLSKAAAKESVHIGVYVEVELGDSRCGTSIENAFELANIITKDEFLDFCGIETFGGFVFHTIDSDMEMKNLESLRSQIKMIISYFKQRNLHIPSISVGGSPAYKLLLEVPEITEVRPGVYVFNDAASVSRGGARFEDCALSVLSTVISISKEKKYAVLDGGGKTFSYCCPGTVYGKRILYGVMRNKENVLLSGLSEEHGILDIEHYDGDLHVGDKVQIIPSHACPLVNLADELVLVEGDTVVGRLNVDARGKSK